jgi:hypothetical protein
VGRSSASSSGRTTSSRGSRNLLGQDAPNHESYRDSWLDLAGYAFIGLLLADGAWPRVTETDRSSAPARPSCEAKRVDDDNRDELARWVGGWTFGVTYVRWFDRDTGVVTEARVGDWIVKTAFGNYKQVHDSTLLAQYDRVTATVTE